MFVNQNIVKMVAEFYSLTHAVFDNGFGHGFRISNISRKERRNCGMRGYNDKMKLHKSQYGTNIHISAILSYCVSLTLCFLD